jgi:hypothetical protein
VKHCTSRLLNPGDLQRDLLFNVIITVADYDGSDDPTDDDDDSDIEFIEFYDDADDTGGDGVMSLVTAIEEQTAHGAKGGSGERGARSSLRTNLAHPNSPQQAEKSKTLFGRNPYGNLLFRQNRSG